MFYDAIFVYPPITEGKKTNFSFAPLGVIYVATFLKQNGFNVKFIDAVINNLTNKEIVDIIIKEKPLILGISSMTCQIVNSIKIAEGIKSLDSNIKIAIGGAHISSTIDEIYKFSSCSDFLIYGEGEYTFNELVKNIKEDECDFYAINGLVFKDAKNKVTVNPPREPINDLDSLPYPDLSLADIKKYESFYAKSKPFTGIIASRGCPFSCTFCDAYATHGRKLRLRSARNIVDEMEHHLNTSGIKQFMIKDSTFTINKKWVQDICNEIISRKMNMFWTCNTRVDMVDKKLLKLMMKAKCYMIQFGIESGSQKVLDKMRKGITVEQIKDCIKICGKVGMDTTGNFMIGNPGEDEESVRKSIDLAKNLDFDFVSFGVTTPYPNTELYEWALENNLLNDGYWYMKDMKFLVNQSISGYINHPKLPVERQIELCKRANREFYFRAKYVFYQLFKLRSDNIIRKFKATLELIKN
jgi:radical SAM superfamily enzyme YgiQ (UPF0313 family)|tara:strand:+ start:1488 stop:2894 length:1407 start_codon:yes stop_codon:yes gene_type:complete